MGHYFLRSKLCLWFLIGERQAGCHSRSWKVNLLGRMKARASGECPYRARVSLLTTSDPLALDDWGGFQVRISELFTLLQ